jgi:hypothetical protein
MKNMKNIIKKIQFFSSILLRLHIIKIGRRMLPPTSITIRRKFMLSRYIYFILVLYYIFDVHIYTCIHMLYTYRYNYIKIDTHLHICMCYTCVFIYTYIYIKDTYQQRNHFYQMVDNILVYNEEKV